MIARVPPPTSVADLGRYSDANPGWQIERDADGTILMSPTNTDGGRRNSRLNYLVEAWNERARGGYVFDSSTGFTMPDGAILSPDCAWVRADRWRALAAAERLGYARIVPDVCIEIVSPSQSNAELVRKARRYRGYGASYVLVLDPQRRDVWAEGSAPDGFPTDFSRVITDDEPEAP